MRACAGNPPHEHHPLRPASSHQSLLAPTEVHVSQDQPKHVDCGRLVKLLGEYVDDQLPPDLKNAVDGHMSQCAPCMAFLKQYRFAPQALRDHLLKKVPADLESRLLSFLKQQTKS